MSRFGLVAGGVVVLATISAITGAYVMGGNAREAHIKERAAIEALKRIQDMEKNNAAFSNLSPYGKCVAYAREQSFDISLCDEFK